MGKINQTAQEKAKIGAGVIGGTVMGAAAGSFYTQSANASELETPEQTSNTTESESVHSAENLHVTPSAESSTNNNSAEVSNDLSDDMASDSSEYIQIESIEDSATEEMSEHLTSEEPISDIEEPASMDESISVQEYQTLTDSEGNQTDVAILSVNGETMLIADVDNDGIADTMMTDWNQNGELGSNEILDISEYNLTMQSLNNQVPHEDIAETLTEDATPDYVNDADINDYMA